MISSLKNGAVFAIAAVCLSSGFATQSTCSLAQGDCSLAYKQGEQCLNEVIGHLIEVVKKGESEKGEIHYELFKRYIVMFYDKEPLRDFVNGVIAGLKKVDIEEKVHELQLSRDQHAMLLAGCYVYIELLPLIGSTKWTLDEDERRPAIASVAKAVLIAVREVYGDDEAKHKHISDSFRTIVKEVEHARYYRGFIERVSS